MGVGGTELPCDPGCCVVDLSEAVRTYAALQQDPTRFRRWVQCEGVRRTVLGLQRQGLVVVAVASEKGEGGGDLISHVKHDPGVDSARLYVVLAAHADETPKEMLRTARARRCLFLSNSEFAGDAREERVPQQLLEWVQESKREHQVRYKFGLGGIFEAWIPHEADKVLKARRGPELPLENCVDYTRRLITPRRPHSTKPLGGRPAALALMDKGEGGLGFGASAEISILSRRYPTTPWRPYTAPEGTKSAPRRAPPQMSQERPRTVDRSGQASSLKFSLRESPHWHLYAPPA